MSGYVQNEGERNGEEQELVEIERIVSVGARKRSLGYSMEESVAVPTASNMICMGKFTSILRGRISFMKSSEKTDEYMAVPENGREIDNLRRGAAVMKYNVTVMASLLKNRLQTHFFYSKHCADILESYYKHRRRTSDTDFRYKQRIRKNIENIINTGVSLEDVILTEKRRFQEMTLYNINYPTYLNDCLLSIADHKNTLEEQVINQEIKQLVEQERSEIMFICEICSRLLAVTPIKSNTALIQALFSTRNIQNEIQ